MIPETIWFQLGIEGENVELYSELGLWWGEEEFRTFVRTVLFLKTLLLRQDERSDWALSEVELLH